MPRAAFKALRALDQSLHHLDTEVHQEDTAVEASQKYLGIAQNRFKLSIDPYLTVVQAQITLLTNQQSAVTIRLQICLQQLLASVQLIEAVGGDWDRSKLSNGDGKEVAKTEKAERQEASISQEKPAETK